MRRRALLTFGALALCGACASPSSPASPSPNTPTIDVLDYLVGSPSLWPRTGNQHQNQIADMARQEVCWVKYGNSWQFECWRWDDQFIYHAVDHALDGNSRDSYHFTDGRWLPRRLPASASAAAPWTLDVARNQIVWFDPSCHVDPSHSHPFPYRLRAWLEPQRDAGSMLGMRDALVFEYEPYDATAPAYWPRNPERYYFGLGAGWYEWERAGFQDFFNRPGGPNTPMDRSVWCQ